MDFWPVEVATVGAALVEATLLPPLPSLPLLVTRIPVCNKLLRSTKSSLRLVSILIMLAYECRSLHFYKYIYVYIRVEWKKIIIYPGFGQGCFQYFQHIVNSWTHLYLLLKKKQKKLNNITGASKISVCNLWNDRLQCGHPAFAHRLLILVMRDDRSLTSRPPCMQHDFLHHYCSSLATCSTV